MSFSPPSATTTLQQTYYVNDSSTNLDEWCTVPGNDANDGLSPASPKATVQGIIDTYTLVGGDVVRIDTGSYLLASNIDVTPDDSGAPGQPVTFEASPYGVFMDRDGWYGELGWHITASYVAVTTATSNKYPAAPQSFLKITGSYAGFYIEGSYVSLSRFESFGNVQYGVYIGGQSLYGVSITNALIHGNITGGVKVYYTTNVHLENCTIVVDRADSGSHYAINLAGPQNFSLTNSIISVRGGTNTMAWFANVATWTSDYNLYWATGAATIA